jgi:hypothetical protein
MTQPPDEHGAALRRVLRAEADAVVPSPEGLEIIRARIERRGVRNLFWWRVGAAAASAVLVAGTIVMVIPELRHQVIERVPVLDVDATSSSTPPAKSSTSRPASPKATVREEPPVVIVPDPTTPPPPQPTETARSTSKPSPTPTTTPTTPCPTAGEEQAEPPSDCPEATPTPTPTPTIQETKAPAAPCPVEECPPADSGPSPSESSGKLVGTPPTAPS